MRRPGKVIVSYLAQGKPSSVFTSENHTRVLIPSFFPISHYEKCVVCGYIITNDISQYKCLPWKVNKALVSCFYTAVFLHLTYQMIIIY